MKTKCIIVDDEPIAIKVIENHLQKFENIEIVAVCKNAMQALEIIKKKNIDLMFLDIQMPEITGIDFLKTLNNPPKVILVTAYRDYAIESYELDVIDYLLKPVSFERFLKAVTKFYQSITNEEITVNSVPEIDNKKFIYIKENKRIHKVFLSDIYYIESMKEYVRIHTSDKTFTIKHSIGSFEKKLQDQGFLRVHKSFIVSIAKIKSFNAVSIELGKKDIPISRTYKTSVLNALGYRID